MLGTRFLFRRPGPLLGGVPSGDISRTSSLAKSISSPSHVYACLDMLRAALLLGRFVDAPESELLAVVSMGISHTSEEITTTLVGVPCAYQYHTSYPRE